MVDADLQAVVEMLNKQELITMSQVRVITECLLLKTHPNFDSVEIHFSGSNGKLILDRNSIV